VPEAAIYIRSPFVDVTSLDVRHAGQPCGNTLTSQFPYIADGDLEVCVLSLVFTSESIGNTEFLPNDKQHLP
jgi:hypothetical protein